MWQIWATYCGQVFIQLIKTSCKIPEGTKYDVVITLSNITYFIEDGFSQNFKYERRPHN